jgi:hypothetical protein
MTGPPSSSSSANANGGCGCTVVIPRTRIGRSDGSGGSRSPQRQKLAPALGEQRQAQAFEPSRAARRCPGVIVAFRSAKGQSQHSFAERKTTFPVSDARDMHYIRTQSLFRSGRDLRGRAPHFARRWRARSWKIATESSLYHGGKAAVSRELAAILDGLSMSAESWSNRLTGLRQRPPCCPPSRRRARCSPATTVPRDGHLRCQSRYRLILKSRLPTPCTKGSPLDTAVADRTKCVHDRQIAQILSWPV